MHSDTSRYVPIRSDFFTQFFTQPFEIPIISHGCQELSHRHKVAVQVRHVFNCQPTKTKPQASQRYQWQVFQNGLEQFEDVHRSFWMKIVPYVYVDVQFRACWWNDCDYNGDCYQPQDSPLTERPESRCKELRSLPATKKKGSQSTKFENWCENVFKNYLRNPQKITKSIENDMKNG